MRFLSVPTFFLWRGNPEISRSQPNMSRMPRGCEITLQGFNKDIGSVSAAEVHESSGKGGCNHKPPKNMDGLGSASYCAPLARARPEAARRGGADATTAKASLGIQRQAISAPRISLIAPPTNAGWSPATICCGSTGF